MPSNGIPLDKAGIMSTVLEGILYGFSVLMFLGTIWALVYHRSTKDINVSMVVVACLLLLLSTMHIICDIIRIEEAFVLYRERFQGGPLGYLADISQPTFVVKNTIYCLQTLLGDGVVIYRCYAVWRSRWILVGPILGWFAVAVAALGSIHAVAKASVDVDIFAESIAHWITSFYTSTLATNLLATGLLAYRIWKIDQDAPYIPTIKRRTLFPVVMIILDAGVLYSVTLLAALVCFLVRSNGQYVTLDLTCPIISIAFYMVIIRVGIAKTSALSRHTVTPMNSMVNQHSRTQAYSMKPMQVHITHLTESNHGDNQMNNNNSTLKLEP